MLGLDLVTVLGPVLTSQSFPSGHAAAAFAGAALVCLAGASVLSSTLALIAACLIALSRCVVGAHWPLDIAMGAPTVFARMLAGSLTVIFFTYAFVNMGMVSGILPVVGVPLPFISYGGTAMVTLGLAMGMLMSVSHARRLVQS